MIPGVDGEVPDAEACVKVSIYFYFLMFLVWIYCTHYLDSIFSIVQLLSNAKIEIFELLFIAGF